MATMNLANVCWSINRALIGEIPSHLRAVQYDVNFDEERVDCFFYYDSEVSEDDLDAASIAMTEASGNFVESFGFIEHVESINTSQPIPERGYWLFLRHEAVKSKIEKLLEINSENIDKDSVCLWLLEALLGKITPALRAVKCDIDESKKAVYFWFYIDGEVSEKETCLLQQVIAETMRHFPAAYTKQGYMTSWPNKKPIPSLGEYVYLRDESTLGEKLPPLPTFDQVLLRLQRALLGRIHPSLRAVKVDVDDCSQSVVLWIYINGPVMRRDKEMAETLEMWASRGTDYVFDVHVERLDQPTTIPHVGTYAYLRYENDAPWGNLDVGNLAPSA